MSQMRIQLALERLSPSGIYLPLIQHWRHGRIPEQRALNVQEERDSNSKRHCPHVSIEVTASMKLGYLALH